MRDNTALIERVREGGQAGRKQNGGRKIWALYTVLQDDF